jgi:NhaP-type Na+/H+ or K+/H+ antiporter
VETFESISKAAEAFLFLYLGLSTYFYADDPWSLNFVLLGVVILGLSRVGGCIMLFGLVRYFIPPRFLTNI